MAASSSQLCSSGISASSLALSCSTRAVATEVSRGARRGASSDCGDGPARSFSSLSPKIASSSGRSAFDSFFVPSTSYSSVSSWLCRGAQMRTRVRRY